MTLQLRLPFPQSLPDDSGESFVFGVIRFERLDDGFQTEAAALPLAGHSFCFILVMHKDAPGDDVAPPVVFAVQSALCETARRSEAACICSNQVIAGENIGKLNVFPGVDLADTVVHRIAYLAYAPRELVNPFPSSLILNTLTPGTSFKVSGGTGTKDERAIIYPCSAPTRTWSPFAMDWHVCFAGQSSSISMAFVAGWKSERREITLREGLAESFLSSIRNRIIKVKEAPLAFGFCGLPDDRNLSIYDATYHMASILRSNNEAIFGAHAMRLREYCVVN